MKKQKRTKFVFLKIVFAAALVLMGSSAWAEMEIGRLAVVSGDVHLTKDANSAGQPAKANDPVHNGDVVKTGNGAAAKVLFTDQSIMDVGANSAFKVTDYDLKQGDNRTGTFSLMYGKLRALVTKQVGEDGNVQVRTKDAVMGVRGTEFVVEQPKAIPGLPTPPTQVMVMTGRLQITPPTGGPSVMVGAGQMLTAVPPAPAPGGSSTGNTNRGNTAATTMAATSATSTSSTAAAATNGFSVVNMNSEQMTTMAQSVKTADNTFISAVTIAPAQNGQSSSGQAQQVAMVNMAAGMPAPAPVSHQGPPPPDVSLLPPSNNNLPPAVPGSIAGQLVHLTISVQ